MNMNFDRSFDFYKEEVFNLLIMMKFSLKQLKIKTKYLNTRFIVLNKRKIFKTPS